MIEIETVIIGGGACGLMCAVQSKLLKKEVLLLEKSNKLGAKILISGGGRCNVTNLHTSFNNFNGANIHFPKSVLKQWTVDDTVNFFNNYGIEFQEKTLGQLFPISNNSKDIVNVFENILTELKTPIYLNYNTETINIIDEKFHIVGMHNNTQVTIIANKLVITTGGLPISQIGATDFALKFAQKLNLPLNYTAPALVPLELNQNYQLFKDLAGVSVFCKVSNAKISFEESILFTHKGLSGPAILQISSYWERGKSIDINFLPHFEINKNIQQQKIINGKKILKNYLYDLLPKRLVDALYTLIPIEKTIGSLTNMDIEKIINTLQCFTVTPTGDLGYNKAEVMRGGIDTRVLSSKNLSCITVPNLYFGGECIDVTGWLGGFNFQWAWACGTVIAKSL